MSEKCFLLNFELLDCADIARIRPMSENLCNRTLSVTANVLLLNFELLECADIAHPRPMTEIPNATL